MKRYFIIQVESFEDKKDSSIYFKSWSSELAADSSICLSIKNMMGVKSCESYSIIDAVNNSINLAMFEGPKH